jgi:hypothetical protein
MPTITDISLKGSAGATVDRAWCALPEHRHRGGPLSEAARQPERRSRRAQPGGASVMRVPDEAEDLAQVRRQNPAWVIVHNEDGTYTGRREWWGNQQIMTLPTLAELAAVLQGLNHGLMDGLRRGGHRARRKRWSHHDHRQP